VNIERRTRTHSMMVEAGAFGVCILANDQQDLALRFGGGVPDQEERLEGVPHRLGELGSPLLVGCLASLECRIHASLPAGTHTVFVGEATEWEVDLGVFPLLYWQREFRSFEEKTDQNF
jgi:flavin reductase (DIM6/NTAB) family NADH-FMN oxidoreductase RutF